MFEPIHTDRLLIRPLRRSDAAALADRRNDPQVARFQAWTLPYPPERARGLVDEVVAMDGPQDEAWWMAAVVDPADRITMGDLVVHLSWSGRTAEVGYTFSPEHWGHGYATEALGAMVEYLFEGLGVTRVFGMLHPDNVASAMVLERCGLVFEGHTRASFWVGDECSDDHIYGTTRPDWERWRDRPRRPPAHVSLVEVSSDILGAVAALRTHKSQERFVAPMGRSFGDALVPAVVDGAPMVPWMRAIEADGTIAGFVLLTRSTPHHPHPYLWRLLIDRRHQRRRIGARTMDLIEDQCRAWGDASLLVTWAEGRGTPAPFYLGRGFVPTGRVIEGEIEAGKDLGGVLG